MLSWERGGGGGRGTAQICVRGRMYQPTCEMIYTACGRETGDYKTTVINLYIVFT